MTPDINLFDSRQAVSEGWDLFDVEGKIEIQRIDFPDGSDPIFQDDPEAVRYVMRQAKNGSKYHQQALVIHALDDFPRPYVKGALGILKIEQLDADEHDQMRISPVGDLVEILSIDPQTGNARVACLRTGGWWFFHRNEWFEQTDEPTLPTNFFQDQYSFRLALKLERSRTINALMERVVEDLTTDGHKNIVSCLVHWAENNTNLGDDAELFRLAENLLDSTDTNP